LTANRDLKCAAMNAGLAWPLYESSVAHCYAQVGDVRLRYVEAGKGPRVEHDQPARVNELLIAFLRGDEAAA
jgi:hypothetical protein